MKKKVMWTLILLVGLMAVGSCGADTVSASTTPGIHQATTTSAATYASRTTNVATKTTNAVATVTATTVTGFKNALRSAKSGSTIKLGSGTYNMNGVTISKNITLQGAGQNKTIFYGSGKRILSIGNVKVNINDIQFKGGSADYGGAIANSGTLTLNNDFFTGNTATRYGGAINNKKVLTVNNCLFTGNKAPGTFEIGYGSGSSILNNRGCTLTVNKSRFTGNSAGSYGVIFQLGNGLISNSYFGTNTAGEGAAIFTSSGGNSQIINDVFENNKAISGAGGALDNYHAISTVTGCTFTGNSALRVGGAIYNDGEDVTDLTQSNFIVKNSIFTNNKAASGGGAIMTYAGTATVSDSTFNVNTSPNGGALYNYMGIFILSNNIMNGNTAPSIVEILSDVVTPPVVPPVEPPVTPPVNPPVIPPVLPQTVNTVAGLTSMLNTAPAGSTIYVASGTYDINGLTISKNIILQGAGQNLTIFNGNGNRILNIGNVQVTINDIQFKGGSADYGGAIANSGTLTLNNDFFTGNTASRYGGAIDNNNVLTVNNCLFTGNTAPGTFEIGYGSGSSILNNRECTLTVNNSTFTGNSAGSYGVIFQLGNGIISNSYFANNIAGEGAAIFTSSGGNSQIINDVKIARHW